MLESKLEVRCTGELLFVSLPKHISLNWTRVYRNWKFTGAEIHGLKNLVIGRWLWLTWQSGHYRHQKSTVHSLSWAKFTVNCIKKAKMKKKAGIDPVLAKEKQHPTICTQMLRVNLIVALEIKSWRFIDLEYL